MIDYNLISDDIYAHGFHIIDGFLSHHHFTHLQEQAYDLYQKGLMKPAKIGFDEHAGLNQTIRRDQTSWLGEDSDIPALNAYFLQAKQIAAVLNERFFLGIAHFESHFAVYQPGNFYKKHCDQSIKSKARKISCVYYLNSDWQSEFGGQLKLYNAEDELIQEVHPQGNRFICFDSELIHEVCVTHQTRFSIAGWMKCRDGSLYA